MKRPRHLIQLPLGPPWLDNASQPRQPCYLFLLWRVIADEVDRILPNISPNVNPLAGVHSTANLVGGGPDYLKR